jgi:hypothetical protein
MRKEGSSQQLFVLVGDVESMPSQDQLTGTLEEASCSMNRQLSGTPMHPLMPTWPRAAKLGAMVGGAVLVGCAVIAAVSTSMTTGTADGTANTMQKNIEIGTKQVPEDLDAAPTSEVMIMGHPAHHCSFSTSRKCPVSELFFNGDVQEVATENLMQVGKGVFKPADRDLVRDTVAAGLENISKQLHAKAPEAFEALVHMKLSAEEKNAVLSWMRMMSIPEVQKYGYEVALAIRRSFSMNLKEVREEIEEMVRNNLQDIQELDDEVTSPQVAKLWSVGHEWQMTLEPENLKVISAFNKTGKFYGSMDASFYSEKQKDVARKLPDEEKAYAAWGGLLEQARVFLDVIKILSLNKGKELLLPWQATALAFHTDKDLGSDVLSCEMEDGEGMNNLMKAVFCPLKYGAQGMDALRAVHQMGEEQHEQAPSLD